MIAYIISLLKIKALCFFQHYLLELLNIERYYLKPAVIFHT